MPTPRAINVPARAPPCWPFRDSRRLLIEPSIPNQPDAALRSPGSICDSGRNARRVEHSIQTLVAQRVFGIALGCEDLVDHDQLRHDPVLATLTGKLEAQPCRLASVRHHLC